jgi:hypothetical protein
VKPAAYIYSSNPLIITPLGGSFSLTNCSFYAPTRTAKVPTVPFKEQFLRTQANAIVAAAPNTAVALIGGCRSWSGMEDALGNGTYVIFSLPEAVLVSNMIGDHTPENLYLTVSGGC